VFSFLLKAQKINVKVTKYLRAPYAYNFWDPFRMQCKPYKNIHDSLYYTKAYDYKTYFLYTNNLVTYDRRTNDEVVIFKYDFLKGHHIPLRFNNLEGIIRDEDTFWISFNGQIKFVVSRDTELRVQKRYVTIANVSDGRFLLKAAKKEEIYLGFLPIFYDIMLPVIHVKENGIFIHLVDLINENSYSMSWYLNDIKTLINAAVKEDEAPGSYKRIKGTILHDIIIEIVEFDIRTYHESAKSEDSNNSRYLTIIFTLSAEGENYKYELRGLSINIELNKNELSAILHFNRKDCELQVLKKSNTRNVVYSIESELSSLPYISLLVRTHDLGKNPNYKTSKAEITIKKDIIYDDGCHYLTRGMKGIIVRKSGEYMMYTHRYNPSLTYRYKQYIFIISYDVSSKLIVIDTESKIMVIFSTLVSNLLSLTRYKMLYFPYPVEKYGILILIHNSLNHIIILEEAKIKQVLDSVKSDRKINGCGKFLGYDVIDTISMDHVCEIYNVPHLISNSIQSVLGHNIESKYLHVLGHYFDNQKCRLYFVVRLVGEDIHTTYLLAWDCSEREVRFKILCYSNSSRNNTTIRLSNCKFKNEISIFASINSMDLYGVTLGSDRFNKFASLYLDTNRFVEVGYYRFSSRLYGGNPELKIDRIGNLILIKHKVIALNKEDDGDVDADSSFCFILSHLHLVKGMQHAVV
jgi:hypothetical protein